MDEAAREAHYPHSVHTRHRRDVGDVAYILNSP